MDSSQFPSYWLKHVEGDDKQIVEFPAAIPQPQTPKEPMEFLSRSWSLSANEISKALATKHMQPAFHNNLTLIPQTVIAQQDLSGKVMKPLNGGRIRAAAIGRLFYHKESNDSNNVKRKDKARMQNAHLHSVLFVAGLAAALAASASTEKSKSTSSEMSTAFASATELLASYCIELAESAGADRERIASVVRSAVGIRTATALRGEAALKARLPKEAKRSAVVSPYEKVIADSHSPAAFHSEIEEEDLPCVGDILQLTRKGMLRWRHVSVYINKACQVTIKLKSKHVGGAFSKNNKCIVYESLARATNGHSKKEGKYGSVLWGENISGSAGVQVQEQSS